LRLYLLLYPIADGTLRDYLAEPLESRDRVWEQSLKESFGCLANTVAFLHSKQIAIKHKDIKPSNILMHSGRPILTDFGISNSFKDQDHSTSSGMTKRSAPYAAPEVIHNQSRNTSQDVFSLGLVFLDIYWALYGKQHGRSELDGRMREGCYPGTELDEDDHRFSGHAAKLAFENAPSFQEARAMILLIRWMTAREKTQQPIADTVWTILTSPTYFGKTCGDCCLPKMNDDTVFTEWSGLQTYVPDRPRRPFDYNASSRPLFEYTMTVGDTTVLPHETSDDVNEPPTGIDWAGTGNAYNLSWDSESEVPIKSIRVLGTGWSAMVDEVHCGGLVVARKSIRLSRHGSRARAEMLAMIKREVSILYKLEHTHILQIIGTYSTQRSFSLLLYPVCDQNLRDLLDECDDTRKTDTARNRTLRIMLKRSMQCLAQALEYIHEQKVRHSDIKPQNILYKLQTDVSKTQVYLADFGASKLIGDDTSSKTEGPPAALTRKYVAPEVAEYLSRGRSVDVWCLGCVFFEMLGAILCSSVRDTIEGLYFEDIDGLHSKITVLSQHSGKAMGLNIPQRQIRKLADLISRMTEREPDRRPLSTEVSDTLGSNDYCYLERESVPLHTTH
jgi:serine/threonine protein kinase